MAKRTAGPHVAPTWPFRATLVALLGLFLWLASIRLQEPLGLDQGLFATIASRLAAGDRLYLDVWDSKPPGVLYTWRVAFALFGTSEHGIWRFESLWILATLFVAFALARRWFDRATGLVAAALLLIGLWAPAWQGYLSRAQAETFLALPALAALWVLVARGGRAVSQIVAGLLIGLASLFKVPAVLMLAPAVCLLPAGSRKRGMLLLALGVAVAWGTTLALLAAGGNAGAMIDAAFGYSAVYARTIAEGSTLLGTVTQMFARLWSALPAIVMLSAIALLQALWKRRVETVALTLWAGVALVGVAAQRQLAPYHFLLAVPPLALLAAHALIGAWNSGGWRRWGLLAAFIAVGSGQPLAWWKLYEPDRLLWSGAIDRAGYLHRMTSEAWNPSNDFGLAQKLASASQPGESVLVWALDPGLYFMSERKPATRFPFHHLLLCDLPLSARWSGLEQRQAEFLSGLERKPPAAILVATRDGNIFQQYDSYTLMVRFERFHRFVSERYREPERIGSYLLYRLKQ